MFCSFGTSDVFLQLNREEFEDMDEETRAQYEGFRPGVYVRVQIDSMPAEFVTNFDPMYPVVLGALLSAEQNIGYVQVSFAFFSFGNPTCSVALCRQQ